MNTAADKLDILETLRSCLVCGHTREQHPRGLGCAAEDCDCSGFRRGALSAEGRREAHRRMRVMGLLRNQKRNRGR